MEEVEQQKGDMGLKGRLGLSLGLNGRVGLNGGGLGLKGGDLLGTK